ncbi:MAG: hypothetical protein U5K28_07990 [Halobacteriales archaeon]|nr:hypothetical protein [Halobacteriales archaeon]
MRNRWLRLVELAVWVTAVTAAIVAVAAVPSFLLGIGLLTLKFVLFVVGVLLFGLASVAIQPKRPRRDRELVTMETADEYGFEARLQQLPPLASRRLPFDDRIDRDTKLFVVSLLVLGVSALLEYGFGIAR